MNRVEELEQIVINQNNTIEILQKKNELSDKIIKCQDGLLQIYKKDEEKYEKLISMYEKFKVEYEQYQKLVTNLLNSNPFVKFNV